VGDYTSLRFVASVDVKSAEAIGAVTENMGDWWPHHWSRAATIEGCPDWVGQWAACPRNSIPFGGLSYAPEGWTHDNTITITDLHWSVCCSIKCGWWVEFFLHRILPQMLTEPCFVEVFDEMGDLESQTVNPWRDHGTDSHS